MGEKQTLFSLGLLSGECADLELVAPVSPGNMEAIHPAGEDGMDALREEEGGLVALSKALDPECRVLERPADFPRE